MVGGSTWFLVYRELSTSINQILFRKLLVLHNEFIFYWTKPGLSKFCFNWKKSAVEANGRLPNAKKLNPIRVKTERYPARFYIFQTSLEWHKRKSFLHRIITRDEIQYGNPKCQKGYEKPGQRGTSTLKPNIGSKGSRYLFGGIKRVLSTMNF